MKRTTSWAFLAMLISIPPTLVAEEPDQSVATKDVFNLTSFGAKHPVDNAHKLNHVHVVISDISLSTFESGIRLLLTDDGKLARDLVDAVDRENRGQPTVGKFDPIPEVPRTAISTDMSVVEFEQVIRIALAGNAQLAKALIVGQSGNK